uniref:Uncharacterized protein n=1 Tax=Aegilops tauschii subsp. strangulata TaxID=200361 RepID=A0A453IW07_AEGTS
MADIAMLVAEEHEKRMKRGAPRAVAGADEEASGGRVNFGAVTKEPGRPGSLRRLLLCLMSVN